ncbi:MAG: hypothetical protein HYS18_16770 [Burkholderiales bacterium]|nr:hypothetical protein [Burkholderiales bacterium]
MTAARAAVLSTGCFCAFLVNAQAAENAVEADTSIAYTPYASVPDTRQFAQLSWQFESGTLEGLHKIVDFWPSIHWLSSSNIASSMAALGYSWRNLKLEGAIFKARETERTRNTEFLKLDSTTKRLSYTLGPNWGVQISRGYRESPDQFPGASASHRTTMSATYRGYAGTNPWNTTLAWGRAGGDFAGNAYLMESAMRFDQHHTVFGRLERAGNDELFQDEEGSHQQRYSARKITLGYLYDVINRGPVRFNIGGLVSRRIIPNELLPYYGTRDTSVMAFLRLQIQFSGK